MEILKPLMDLYKLNTRLLKNCLDGITEEKAKIRLNDETNNIYYILCHLVGSRYYLARLIGMKIENPFEELFAKAQTIDDFTEFPEISILLDAWKNVSEEMISYMNNLDEITLNTKSPWPLPDVDNTTLGVISFMCQHDGYHIGQIAFIRKYLGFGAMSYK